VDGVDPQVVVVDGSAGIGGANIASGRDGWYQHDIR
jgi:hypothetical protein